MIVLTRRQLLCTYLMDPRHLQGEMSWLLGSMAGSWQIRHAGIDSVEEDVDRPPAVDLKMYLMCCADLS